MNLNISQSNHLKVTLLLETLPSGRVAASILEVPSCRIEAATRDEAITQVQAAFLDRLPQIEAISWEVPVQVSEPAWMKFAGIFAGDRDFEEIMDAIRAERNSKDESEVDPSYYQ